MIRVLLFYVAALVFPLVAFMLWRYLAGLAKSTKGAAPVQQPPVPWTWLSLAGVILLMVAFVFMATLDGGEPDQVYHPPKLIDGKIQPGHFEPAAPTPAPTPTPAPVKGN